MRRCVAAASLSTLGAGALGRVTARVVARCFARVDDLGDVVARCVDATGGTFASVDNVFVDAEASLSEDGCAGPTVDASRLTDSWPSSACGGVTSSAWLAMAGAGCAVEFAVVVSLDVGGCEASTAGGVVVSGDAPGRVAFCDVSGVDEGVASRAACESCVDAGPMMAATHC